jgi:hypothetical protein
LSTTLTLNPNDGRWERKAETSVDHNNSTIKALIVDKITGKALLGQKFCDGTVRAHSLVEEVLCDHSDLR